MEAMYTVQQLAELAGISGRTLRYYDQIDLLKPAKLSKSGYRLYSDTQTSRLQHILFLRELDMSLEDIRRFLDSENFNRLRALKDHRSKIEHKRSRLDTVLNNLNRSIGSEERGEIMGADEKFEGLKEKMVVENEEKFGKEARSLWGNDAVDAANKNFYGKTREEFEAFEELSALQLETLHRAQRAGDPASADAQEAAKLHRKFLEFWVKEYSPEYHAGMVQMYLDDQRFADFYDKQQPGSAQFLKEAVMIYLTKEFNFTLPE